MLLNTRMKKWFDDFLFSFNGHLHLNRRCKIGIHHDVATMLDK